MGFLVLNKVVLAIALDVALVTGQLVRVMCNLHVELKMAPVITHVAPL